MVYPAGDQLKIFGIVHDTNNEIQHQIHDEVDTSKTRKAIFSHKRSQLEALQEQVGQVNERCDAASCRDIKAQDVRPPLWFQQLRGHGRGKKVQGELRGCL